jgi:hypothetical protein
MVSRKIFKALDRIMSGDDWPNRWMTIPQIIKKLDRLDFWAAHGLVDIADQKAEILRSAFFHHVDDQEGKVWVRIGSQYKHTHKLTAEDRTDLGAWIESRKQSRTAAMKRFLLGSDDRAPSPPRPPGRTLSVEECLAKVDRLLRKVRRCAAELGWRWVVEAVDLHGKRLTRKSRWHRQVISFKVTGVCIATQAHLREEPYTHGTLPANVVQILRLARQMQEAIFRCPRFFPPAS